MITKQEYIEAKERAISYFNKAGITITDEEKAKIEVADFGKGELENIGLEILTYVNTTRVCAKELVLFPGQTCPEHRHIDSNIAKGKEETFRVRYGEVLLYVEGAKTDKIQAKKFWKFDDEVSVFHEIHLLAGEQYTLLPNTKHWFQGGKDGAVVSEFSTTSTDETDIFTDKRILRMPEIAE